MSRSLQVTKSANKANNVLGFGILLHVLLCSIANFYKLCRILKKKSQRYYTTSDAGQTSPTKWKWK